MALCGVATIVLVALVLAELGASQRQVVVAVGVARTCAGRARADLAEHLRRVACAADGAARSWLLLRDATTWPRSALLGLAVSAKVYPLVLVPVAAVAVWRRAGPRRTALGIGTLLLVAAAVVVPFAAYAPHGVYESFRSQAARGLQVESLGASLLLALDRLGLYDAQVVRTTGVAGRNLAGGTADIVAAIMLAAEALAVALVWGLYARASDARRHLPLAFAAAVAGFLAFTKVFSPQYLVWLLPLVVAAAEPAAVALVAVALVLAQVWFFHYGAL